MNFITDLFITSKMALTKTIGTIGKCPTCFLMAVPYIIMFNFASMLLAPLGIFGGIILYIFECGLLSSYLYFINEIMRYGKFDFGHLRFSLGSYFSKVMGVLFIFWIANLFLSVLLNGLSAVIGMLAFWIMFAINLAIFILLNPVPEIIYHKAYNEVESIKASFAFIKENAINWLVPNLLLAALIYFVGMKAGGALPGTLSAGNFGLAMQAILGAVLTPIMVFRGYLFETLSTSSRRKRYFMRDMTH